MSPAGVPVPQAYNACMRKVGLLLLLAASAAAQDVEKLKKLAPVFDTKAGSSPESLRIDARFFVGIRLAYVRDRGGLQVWNLLDGCPLLVACGTRAVFYDALDGTVQFIDGVVPELEFFQEGETFHLTCSLVSVDDAKTCRINVDVPSIMSKCQTLEARGPGPGRIELAGRNADEDLLAAWIDPSKSPAYRRVVLVQYGSRTGNRVEMNFSEPEPADFPEIPDFETLSNRLTVTRSHDFGEARRKILIQHLLASLLVTRGLARAEERELVEAALSNRVDWATLEEPYAKARKALISRFGRGPLAGHYERAGDAFNAGQLEEAQRELEQALKDGDTRALARLGHLALVLDEDVTKARDYLRRSAELEYPEGQFALGALLEETGDDLKQAAAWYRRAAESGHVDAAARLGRAYRYGNGVPRDLEKAARWYTVAAEAGDVDAQFALGTIFLDGTGVGQDYPAAVKWYTKAAEQGHAQAQLLLGTCYDLGRGVEEDRAKAASLYRQAAEQGNAVAQRFLGRSYLVGSGVEKDPAAGVRWLEAAVKQGLPEACVDLAKEYDEGKHVARNPVRAHALYVLGGEPDEAARLARDMTPEQVAESARLQKHFKESK